MKAIYSYCHPGKARAGNRREREGKEQNVSIPKEGAFPDRQIFPITVVSHASGKAARGDL